MPEDETFTGSDGLEYTFSYVFLTLTINGTGACTSVTNGKLRTNDSQTITIADKFYEGIGYRDYCVQVNEGVTSIGSSAFSTDTSLISIELADSVTSVGSQAFYNCTSLKTLRMGAGLTGMAYQKIQNCPIETLYTGGTVYLGSLLGQIKQAVSNRSYLKYLYIGTGCTTVSTSSSYAIPSGLHLESIHIGPNVSSISSNAFTNCSDLKTFYVNPSNTAYVADNGTLYTVGKATLVKHPPLSEVTALSISAETTSLASGSLNDCKNLVSITVDPENENYSSEDGVLYNKAKTRLLVYPISKPDTVYTMLSTVTAVEQQGPAANGLSSNKYLKTLNLSVSLTLFNGYSQLQDFTALEEINVPDENTSYKSIDGVLFSKNWANQSLLAYPYNKISNTYTIPDGYTAISTSAFRTQHGAITVLYIPSSVTGTGSRTVYASCTINQSSYTITSNSLGGIVLTDPADILETQDGFVYVVASVANRLLYYKGTNLAYVTAPDLYEGAAYDISAFAFYEHDEITDISLPYAQILYGEIISKCNSLRTVTFGQYAQKTYGYDTAFHGPVTKCPLLESYSVASNNTKLHAEDGVLFGQPSLNYSDENWLICYPSAKTTRSYIIPEGTQGISDRAFAGTQFLKDLTLAQSLTSSDYVSDMYERSPFADNDSIETLTVYADQKYGGYESVGCAALRNIVIIPSSAEGGTTVEYRDDDIPIWLQKNASIRTISISEGITHVHSSVTPSSLNQLNLPASLSIIYPQSAPNLQTLSLYDTGAVSLITPDSSWDAPLLKYITIHHTSEYTSTWANGQPWANSTVPLDITIESGVVVIPTHAFKGADIEHLSVPYSVTTIGVSAFEDSTGLSNFPAEYVTTIQTSAFKNCADLESIDLSSVTTIGNEAFEGCAGLTECDISSVTALGTDAFTDCAGITTLTVPASVTTVQAFDGCTNITEITLLGSEIPVYGTTAAAHTPWYISRANTPRINFPANLQLIGSYAFKDCSFTTESLDFSHLQAPVGTYAFANCSGPVNANISYGASSYAFANCTTLRAVAFSTAANIGEHAFDGAYNVGALALTGSAAQWSNRIGTAAFSFGTQSNPATVSVRAIADLFTTLDTTTYRGNYTTFTLIPQAIIGTDGLTYTIDDTLSLTVTNTTGTAKAITSLSNCVLTGHESGSSTNTTYNLRKTVIDMTVDQNITSINSSAMRGAQALRDVHLVDVYNIATFCFYESSIRTLTYDASSMSIGREAFSGCTSLTNVVATNNSAAIGISDSGFRGCTSLENITQMGSITFMGYTAFAYCTAITTVPIGPNLAQGDFDAIAFSGCTAISTITVQNNPYYTVVDGVLYDASQTVLYMYPPMKAGTIFTVPSTVTSIESQAFQYLQALLCVIIPSSVQRIYNGAFNNAISLIKVVFQGVFRNDGSLFSGCYGLKDVEIREWNITTDFSPSDFYLGDAQHNASCVVYSPYNYASTYITSEPNSYTHIEFINILSEEYTAMGSTPGNPLRGVIIDVARFGGASLKYIDEGTLILASGGTSVVNYTGEDINVSVTDGTMASGTEGVTIGRGVVSYTWGNSSAATTLFVLPLELTPSHEAIVFTSTGSGMWTLANTPYTSESLSAIIPLYEGAELNITDLSNVSYLLSGYDLQFTGPEDMSSIGLSKSSLGTKLGGTFINVPDAIDAYYAPFNVVYRQVPIIGSVQSAPIVFKIYKSPEICPISIGYSIDVPNDYSHGFYPISQVFSQNGERTEDYADPNISDSVTYDDTARGTCRVTCSLPMLGFPYTPTTRTPITLIGWTLTRNGTVVKSYAADTTLTLQLNALTYGCALIARLAPATRIHYISSDSRTLAGSDILLRSTANAINYKLPAMETTESGYSVEQWSYGNASGADLYAYPSQTVSIVPDSVSGRTIDGTVYSHVVSLVGMISFLLKGDEPFIIVFDPAGGTFMTPGELTERGLPLPTATVSVNVPFKLAYDYTKKLWVWWAYDTANFQTKMDVTFANIPYDPASGLQPPAGIAMAKAWEISAPYFQSPDESPDAFTVPLKRSSTDSICQKTAYPEWIPDRTSHQRAILTAPGYGAIDLGNIQSINETYSSDVKQIPIVVYGYTRSFCMDLGVKKEMSINYIRTVPQVIDDTSGDSRDWSNAKWIEMLKSVMNRWQMRTNGNQLYLLRPNVEREGETPADPMSEYADEIYGVNCYISSLPIKYDQNPHIIAGSIDLSMGTLYPKTPEATPYIVKFRPDASTPWTVIENSGRFMNLLHPYNIKGWGGTSLTVKKEGDNWVFTGYVFKCWKDSQNHEYTFNEVVDISKLVDRGIALEFTADTDSISRVNGKVYFGDTYSNEDGSSTSKDYTARIVKGSNPGDTVDVLYGVVGGGGGGGAASIQYPQRVLGGGGGASGQFRFNRATWNYNGRDYIDISISCGCGGLGVPKYDYAGTKYPDGVHDGAGGHGGKSTISAPSSGVSISASGGGGGERGSVHSYNWGKTDVIALGGGNKDNTSSLGGVTHTDGLKKGGNGGQKGVEATAGDSYSTSESGRGGVQGQAVDDACGGGGGGGGFYYAGMEQYGFGNGGGGGGGTTTISYSGSYPTPVYQLETQNGGYGAGGGGGGGLVVYEGSSFNRYTSTLGGGNGGPGWAFICVISGGTLQ